MQTIYSKANAIEDDTVRILTNLVRTPSFSCKEKECVQIVRREMLKIGFDESGVDGLGNSVGRIGSGQRKNDFDGHVDPFQPIVELGIKSIRRF